jgi:hypothetical protein
MALRKICLNCSQDTINLFLGVRLQLDGEPRHLVSEHAQHRLLSFISHSIGDVDCFSAVG